MKEASCDLDPRIISAVFKAIDDLNHLLPEEYRLEKGLETPILGATAVLDSMGFVNFIAAVEDRIMAELGMNISLLEHENRRGTFRTVGTLAGYISQILAAKDRQSTE